MEAPLALGEVMTRLGERSVHLPTRREMGSDRYAATKAVT